MSSTDPPRSDELTRRHFMNMAARSCLGVRVMPYFGGMAALLSRADGAPSNAAAKAEHVIYLFMSGGMSHIDTFDPKPKKKEVMGPTDTIASRADGVQLDNGEKIENAREKGNQQYDEPGRDPQQRIAFLEVGPADGLDGDYHDNEAEKYHHQPDPHQVT